MRLLAFLLALMLPTFALAATVEQPEFAPQIGTEVDLATSFTDSTGQSTTLAALTAGRPSVVVFGYHNCPNLCGVTQGVVGAALAGTGLPAGSTPALFITLAPDETPVDAAAAKSRFAAEIGDAAAQPWHFLSGPAGDTLASDDFGIGTLTRERIRQYVHPVATFVLTADGRISRVLPGLDVTANDLRLALVDASAGKLGTVFDHIALFCSGYDWTVGQWTPWVITGLRIGAIGTLVLGLGGLVWIEWRRRRWTA